MSMKRPSLGQIAELGDLYDATTDSFVSLSLLSGPPPPSAVRRVDNSSIELEFTNDDTYEEKFRRLGLSAELGASFLSGFVELNLTAFTNSSLKSHLNLDLIRRGRGTHILSEVQWGASCVVTARYQFTDSSNKTEIQGKFNAACDKLKGLVDIGASSEGGLQSNKNNPQTTFEIKVYGDIVTDDNIPTDFESACKYIKNMPSSIAASNGGKGKPLVYTLLPFETLHYVYDLDIQHHKSLKQLSDEILEKFVQLFDEWRSVRQRLTDYYGDVKSHEFCLPRQYLREALDQLDRAKINETKLKESYAKVLKDVRSGTDDPKCLWSLLADSGKAELSPDNLLSITLKYQEKMKFADIISAKGARYLKYNRTTLDNAIMESKTQDAYVLYFNDTVRAQATRWEDNQHLIMDLLESGRKDYQVIVCDCDLGNSGQLEKPYIEQRRDGKVIIADVVQDRRELDASCCVKCSDQSKVDRSRSVKLPLASRIMRIPCPIKRCHASGKYTWICSDCRQEVSYGFTDDCLYCMCGRYPYSLAVFKCRNHVAHGKGYVKYEDADLLKLLKALDIQEQYNILLLGETGVGKSMFLNSFHNYINYDRLGDAMVDSGGLQYLIPFAFSYQEKVGGKTEKREVIVGEATSFETLSRAGQSGTTQPGVYTFNVGNKVIKFIDTPGIGDTQGITQDEKNMRAILRTLERGAVDKLSAVLILLKPNVTRLTPTFEFCLTELLRHLHQDIAKNMLFGFTSASATRYTLGATEGLLNKVLRNLKTNIVLGERNQFFFDSEGYMFLADYKLHGQQRQGRPNFDEMWTRSADETHRLLSVVMDLDVHDVRRTLEMNRIRQVLEGMARPLTEFAGALEQSQSRVGEEKRNLKKLDLESQIASEKLKDFKISITVPVRHKLPSPRLVCGHASCCQTHVSEDGSNEEYKSYQRVCHENCDLKAPDMVPGADELWWCYAFRRALLFRGFLCSVCDHQYTDHLLISSEYVRETRQVEDRKVLGELESLEEKKQEARRLFKVAEDSLDGMHQEEMQIKKTRAQIAVYLKHNAVAAQYDSTVAYIDYCISLAHRNGQSDKTIQLMQQQRQHKDLVATMDAAIASGANTPLTEEDIFKLIEDLKSMKVFGKFLADALEQDSKAEDASD